MPFLVIFRPFFLSFSLSIFLNFVLSSHISIPLSPFSSLQSLHLPLQFLASAFNSSLSSYFLLLNPSYFVIQPTFSSPPLLYISAFLSSFLSILSLFLAIFCSFAYFLSHALHCCLQHTIALSSLSLLSFLFTFFPDPSQFVTYGLDVDRLFLKEWQRTLQMPTAGTVDLLQLTMWPSRRGWAAEDTALLKEDFVGG